MSFNGWLQATPTWLTLLVAYAVTVLAYVLGRVLNQRLPAIPAIIWAVLLLMGMLAGLHWPYAYYLQRVQPLFDHLLGYVTVALAVPLAAMRLDDLPLRMMTALLTFASVTAVLLPVGLAYVLHLSEPTLLAYTTRAVTTPVALNIAAILHAPAALVSLIVILSGVIGAACSSILLRKIDDERAVGLALGLAAHAIGTVQAWQRNPVAGRFAAFGMAVNALLTAIWLPLVYLWWFKTR